MKTIIFFISVFISQSVFAQLSPVLFDADDKPIGNVVGIRSFRGSEVVDMVSLKGYRAIMTYQVNGFVLPFGHDFPGGSAFRFFESNDCTGDPVMLPRVIVGNPSTLKSDFSNAIDFLTHGELARTGLDEFYPGDMLEFEDASYYIPLDSTVSEAMLQSFKTETSAECIVMDRCSSESWQQFDRLIFFNPFFEACPNIDGTALGEPLLSNPGFVGYGYRLSGIQANDPTVTGFQSIKYRWPNRIKYVDINKILTDGFESGTQEEVNEAQQTSTQNPVEGKSKTGFDRGNRLPRSLNPREDAFY